MDLGLTPWHGPGEHVVEPGVADQKAWGVVEPRLGIEIEPLQTGEPGIRNRLAFSEQRWLQWFHCEHMFDDRRFLEKLIGGESVTVAPS
jgi:hypothetical protein